MENILRKIDSLNRRVGETSGWLILAVIFVMMYEVISRYVFNAPTSWAQEMSWFLYAALFILGMGYTERYRGHVTVDIFYSKFSPKSRAIIDIVCYLLLFGFFMTVLFWKGVQLSVTSWQQLERTSSSWQPPLYVIKTVLPVGVFLLLIQGLTKVVRNILFLVKGDETVDETALGNNG